MWLGDVVTRGRSIIPTCDLGRIVVLLAGLLVAGCTASSSAYAPQQATASLPAKPSEATLAPDVLREHQRILAAYGGIYNEPRLQTLIERAVERLVAASERPDLHYKITVLNSQSVNAFALPTGQLYVTRGLIALANDDSELASVLAHEMGHVLAHHAELREEHAREADLVSRVVSDVVTDPAAGALALAKSKLALASFSRAQEFEADAIGVAIASRAGYDPYGAVRFLTAMEHNSQLKPEQSGAINPAAPDFLSSHPATPERITNAIANARQYRAPADAGQNFAQSKSAYLADINGLVYGEDPSEGFVRGRRFLHPRLGFVFTAPDGFVLDNTSQAVLGMAASGVAKGDQWTFRLYALRFGADVYRFIFATKQPSPEEDQAFRDSIDSFRRMTATEIQTAKPLRVQVVTVKAGDTPELLAGQMAVQDRALERFLILNGLQPSDHLKPGDQVKVVSE